MQEIKLGVRWFLPPLTFLHREMPGSTRALLKLIEKMEMKASHIVSWIVRDIVHLHFTPSNLQNSSDTVLKNIAAVEKR